MSKHTPGPWTPGRPDMGTYVDGVKSKWIYAGDRYVAVASGLIEGDRNEVMANARLIAAAPELFAELEGSRAWLLWALRQIHRPDTLTTASAREDHISIRRIDAVLALATGGPTDD